MGRTLPAHVERFIFRHLDSLEHLDALLAIHREPARWWTGESIAEAIGTRSDIADRVLEDLCSANLLNVRIASAVAYQYNPASAELAGNVDDLADCVRAYRTRVYALVTARSTRALRDFARAFRLKGRNRG